MNLEKAFDSYTSIMDTFRENEIIEFTQSLIRTNSVNPNLEANHRENEVARLVADECEKASLKVEIQEVAPGRPNVVCILPGKTDEIGLLFLSHTDTVPALGMENPFSGEIIDHEIWGRGSVDMKGGLAASVQAAVLLARSKIELEKGVAVAAVVDEESEHRGAYTLGQQKIQADFAIVPEPTDLRLVLGCNGTAPIRMDFEGIQAHGSTPELGVNAIEKAVKAITALGKLKPIEFTIPELNKTIHSTCNVGVISGGTAYNNVPDHCSVFLDRRMVPGETQGGCLLEVQEVLDRLSVEDSQFKASAQISRPDWHWEPIKQRGLNPTYTSVDTPVAQAVRLAHSRVYTAEPILDYSPGYLDMDFLVNDLKIPSINYGPGIEGYCHSNHERLSIEQLLVATRVYILTALQLCL